jgi:molecular chaperone GrpE
MAQEHDEMMPESGEMKEPTPDQPSPTDGCGDDLAQQLDATARECAAAKDRYLRLFAEFENYKKRIQRDQLDYNKYATEKLLRELLPVADNLERAIAHARSTNADSATIDGLDLIARQFQDALQKAGIEPISAVGKVFDPALHQALAQVESSEHEPDTVVEEAQRGYVLHGRILRPSLVTVAKLPAPGQGRGT